MTCPSEAAILLCALDAGADTSRSVERHASECAACRADVGATRRLMAALIASNATAQSGDGACLDEAGLVEIAEGSPDSERRSASIAHVAGCGHCRRELAALVELLSDPGVAAEVSRLERTQPRRWLRGSRLVGAGAVAAAVVLAVVWPRGEQVNVLHRSPTITAASVPALTSPIGDVSEASALRWAAVAGADKYRVTLFDATGHVVYTTQILDTIINLPDSVVLAPGQSYLWKVEARAGFERWTSSDLIEFRVARPRK